MILQFVFLFTFFQHFDNVHLNRRLFAHGPQQYLQYINDSCQDLSYSTFKRCQPCQIVLKYSKIYLATPSAFSRELEDVFRNITVFLSAIRQKNTTDFESDSCCGSGNLIEALQLCTPPHPDSISHILDRNSKFVFNDQHMRIVRHVTHSHGNESGEHSHHEHSKVAKPSKLYTGFLSFLVVTVINCIPLFGLLIQKCKSNPDIYNVAIQFFIAMAVGALLGDALIHILPETFGSHHHEHSDLAKSVHRQNVTQTVSESTKQEEEEEHDHKDYVKLSTGLILGIVVMYVIEVTFIFLSSMGFRNCHGANHNHDHSNVSHKHKTTKQCDVGSSDSVDQSCEHKDAVHRMEHCLMSHQLHVGSPVSCQAESEVLDRKDLRIVFPEDHDDAAQGNEHHRDSVIQALSGTSFDNPDKVILKTCHGFKKITTLALMLVAGDSIHNFIDGFNIGVSFLSGKTMDGFTTSAAVVLHEIPHEIGDLAVLMNTGLTYWQAFFFHLISGIFCYIGAISGTFVGMIDPIHVQRVKCATAGMFLYICLTGLVPGMLKDITSTRLKKETVIAHFFGFLIGITMMYLLVLME